MKKQQKTLLFKVDAPCQEKWSEMIPVRGGRFCDQCEKRVVDFTKMTDQEMIAFAESSNGSTCGRFRPEQLNRQIALPNSVHSSWHRQLAVPLLAAGITLSSQLVAQTSGLEVKDPIEWTVSTIGEVRMEKTSIEEFTINGIVKDLETGEPLIGANLLVKGTTWGTITDFEGKFALSDIKEGQILICSYLGYEPQEILLTKPIESYTIELIAGVELEEVVVLGYGGGNIMDFTMGGIITLIEDQPKKAKPIPKPKAIKTDKIFPNPFMDYFTLEFDVKEKDSYLINIYSSDGKLVYAKTEELIPGRQSIQINNFPNALSAGHYVLQLMRGNEIILTRKIIKTKK